jgi:hypothetical protein
MDCRQAKELLLQCDDPAALAGELAAHCQSCAACTACGQEIDKIEQAWRAFPIPPAAERAKAAFLHKLAGRVTPPARFVMRRPALQRGAVAAMVLAAAGLGVLLLLPAPQAHASPDVLTHLIDWNLALTQAETPAQRQRLFSDRAAPLTTAVAEAKLPHAEQALARTLLENGAWLVAHPDPAAAAERFDDVADRLLEDITRAARRKDSGRLKRFAEHYRRVVALGVQGNVDRAEAAGTVTRKRFKQIERSVRRDKERAEKLAELLERAPEASRKEICRALELPRKHPRRKGELHHSP